jgi:hypothetical protein
MVWSHYVNELNTTLVNDYDNNGDESDVYAGRYLSFDDWVDWYHNDLVNMYRVLTVYREDAYVTNLIMENAMFEDFCWFCYNYSSGYGTPYRSS